MSSSPRPTTLTAGCAAIVAVLTAGLAPASAAAQADTGTDPSPQASSERLVTFHGYRLRVPSQWRVVDLASRPHECLTFDRPAVYLGHAGDQRSCPSHLIGGAPGLHLEPLDRRSAARITPATVRASATGGVSEGMLPANGPVTVAVPGAGVLVSAVYAGSAAARMQRVLERGRVSPSARPAPPGSLRADPAPAPAEATSAPGAFHGRGFDTCTAPGQPFMTAWRASSLYRAVGVYIGGVSRGCAQPALTATWVARQARAGWHLIPTYVGRQAPCTGYYHRISARPLVARAQGRAEGRDAAARAAALGIGPGSTIYSDIEAYNNTLPACTRAVLAYTSGWTFALHAEDYQAGVYSSAASGIRDLSGNYNSERHHRPDHIWLAWWNGVADVDGGLYLPDSQWGDHQRIHQYIGNRWESHGGYSRLIDRNFLDVR